MGNVFVLKCLAKLQTVPKALRQFFMCVWRENLPLRRSPDFFGGEVKTSGPRHFIFRNALPGPPSRADIGSLQGMRSEGSSLATPRVKGSRNLAEIVLPFPQQASPLSPVLHHPHVSQSREDGPYHQEGGSHLLVNLGCAQTDQHQRTCFYAIVSVLCAEIPQMTTLRVSALMELTFQKRNRGRKVPQEWMIQHWAPPQPCSSCRWSHHVMLFNDSLCGCPNLILKCPNTAWVTVWPPASP